MTGCTTGLRVGRWALALVFAGVLCAAASLVATVPAFAADTYTITIKADDNAVVDPPGSPLNAPVRTLTVDAGSSKTFMFYPHNPNGPQYRIKEVKVDNVDVTSGLVAHGGTYTLSNIQADHMIEVTSEPSDKDVEGFGFTDKIALDDTRTITPLPAGGTWWNSDPSVLRIQQIGTSGSYLFKGLKAGNAYAMYAVDLRDGKGPLIRRISIEVTHNAFDAGNLKYAVLKENAPGKAGAPGENTVWMIGKADGQDPKSIVIPSTVSGNAGSPGTVYEVTGVKSSAFSDNTTLESVDFSNCDVTRSFVGNDSFRTCTSLKQLVFGQKTAPTIVNGFFGAGAVGTVYWPEGATGYATGMFQPATPGGDLQLENWTFESYPVPTAPQTFAAVSGDGKVDLSWTAPAEGMGIQKYQYSVTADGSEDWKDIPLSDRSTTGYEVKGLANRTSYTLKVRAVNGAGEGAAATVAATPGTPTAPEGLAAVPGHQQVVLSWTAVPAAYNAVRYQYSATADGTDAWQDVPGSDGSTASYAVPGLTDGTAYTFKVRAVNAIGEGEATAGVTSTPAARLLGIVAPNPLAGIANGTPLADIALPSQVTVETEAGRLQVDVAWDRTTVKPAYDPSSASKQKFAVSGTVNLPTSVGNPDGLSLATSVSVTVEAKAAPPKPVDPKPVDPKPTPAEPKALVRTGDTALPIAVIGIAVLAGGAVLAAKRLRLR